MKRFIQVLSVVIVLLLLAATLNRVQVSASSGSMIGPIDVSGMSKKEMIAEVQEKVAIWQERDIAIQGGMEEVTVQGEIFRFDAKRSVENFQQAQKSPWYDFWSPKPEVQSELFVYASEELSTVLEPIAGDDVEQKIEDILLQVATLPTRPLKITIDDFDVTQGKLLSSSAIQLEAEDMEAAAVMVEKINGHILKTNEEFSFSKVLGKKTNGNVANIVASALYINALQSGFDVLERHQSLKIPDYVNPGFEAVIDPVKQQNLVFKSMDISLVKMLATVENEQFKLQFYRANLEKIPEIMIYTANKKEIEAGIIYRYSKKLFVGESENVQESVKGQTISVYRQQRNAVFGTEKTLISANYYAPVHKVVLQSMDELPESNDIEPIEEDVVEVPDVAGDEQEIIEDTTQQNEDRNEIIIRKVEHPTDEELADEDLIYSEEDDSYYYIELVDSKGEGEK